MKKTAADDDVWVRHMRRMERSAKQEPAGAQASVLLMMGMLCISAGLLLTNYLMGMPLETVLGAALF